MKLEDHEWVAGLQLAAATVLCAAPLPWASWLATEGAPAWVQALGSVGAILIAIWIDRAASRRASALDRQHREARLLACSRLVSLLRVKAAATLESLEAATFENLRVGTPVRKGYEVVLQTMSSFPVADLPNTGAVFHFVQALEFGDHARALLAELDEMIIQAQQGLLDPRQVMAHRQHFRQIVEILVDADDALRELAEPGWRAKLASARQAT